MRRVFDYLMRHLVHWLRRRRYARMAGRIRALEIELGMVDSEGRATGWYRYSHGTAFGVREHERRGEEPCRDCVEARRENNRRAVAAHHVVVLEQHATDHARNFFANGDTSPAFGGVVAYWTEQAAALTDPTTRSSE